MSDLEEKEIKEIVREVLEESWLTSKSTLKRAASVTGHALIFQIVIVIVVYAVMFLCIATEIL